MISIVFGRVLIFAVTSVFIFVMPTARSDFTKTDLRGPFIRRYRGPSPTASCPDNFAIQSSALNLTGDQILVNGNACQSGLLELLPANADQSPAAYLAKYVSAEQGAGTVLIGRVTETILCSVNENNYTFDPRAIFTFVRANANISVDLRAAYQRNDTELEIALGRPHYTFLANVSTVVINSLCLYTELSTVEVDEQRTEACFPASALLSLATTADGGAHRIQDIRIQDADTGHRIVVSQGGHVSPVIGWTHRDATAVSQFVRIVVQSGHILTVSPNHYVYANDNVVIPARKLAVGDRMKMTVAGNATVVHVSRVWRIGLYNLQTIHGDVVVNKFVCSTYTEVLPPATAHSLLVPARLLSLFGIDALKMSGLFHRYDTFNT